MPSIAKNSNEKKSVDNNKNNNNKREGKSFSDYYEYYDYGDMKAKIGQGSAKVKPQQHALSRRQLDLDGVGSTFSRLLGSSSNSQGSYSGLYGSYSSHGYDDCDNGISIALLTTALLGIGVLFFTLYTKITMGRKKRSADEEDFEGNDSFGVILNGFSDLVYGGNDISFESRV